MHDYFTRLTAHPKCVRSVGFRDQAEIDRYIKGGKPPHPTIHYDAGMDAAQIVLPADKVSVHPNLWVPLPPYRDKGTMLVTWDSLLTSSYQWSNTNIEHYKHFQFTSPDKAIWCEVKTMFKEGEQGGGIGYVQGRYYDQNKREDDDVGDEVLTTSELTPYADPSTRFLLRPNVWTRYWALFEFDGTYDRYSLLVADDTRPAYRVFDRLPLAAREGRIGGFLYEYNTSAHWTPRAIPECIAATRNLVVLQGVDVITFDQPRLVVENRG
jgi:hypothetical protein